MIIFQITERSLRLLCLYFKTYITSADDKFQKRQVMKKNILTLLAVLIGIGAQAQTGSETNQGNSQSDEIKTLFSNTGGIGWWVSPDFEWTQFEGDDVFLGGLSGGIIINHSFSLGLGGYGILNSQNLRYSGINDTADVYLYGGYGGLKLEFRLNPLNLVHVAFPLLIGGGGVAYSTWGHEDWNSYMDPDDYDYAYAWDSYFVIEPGVVIGINLLRFMRLDAGVSYRYAPGIELPRTSSNLLNGFGANISLKFGSF